MFKASLIFVLALYTTLFYAQNTQPLIKDSLETLLNKGYKGGAKAFYVDLANSMRYPMEARQNCRMGIALVSMKIRPSGAIDSILFRHEVEIGMGIETELARCLLLTKGKWLKDTAYTSYDFSVAFQIEDGDKLKGSILVEAYASPPSDCPTIKDAIKGLEKAKKKEKYKKAIEFCEDILRRMPDSDEYKKELAALKSKLK